MLTTPRTLPAPRSGRPALAAALATVRDCVALTRPRITLVVGLTAAPVLLERGGSRLDPAGALGVLLGIALVGAGSSAINAWWERDLDARMARTRTRPLPSGRLAPGEALTFGLLCAALGTLLLAAAGGALAAWIGVATLAWYIVAYTVWAKPRTALSTAIGAVAGAAAPLIADAAVHGRLTPFGISLFAIILVWQLPHVWAIALFRAPEYAAAGVPLLPARVGEVVTRRWMLAFALALVPVSLLPWRCHALGAPYAVTALALDAWFLGAIVAAMRRPGARADRAAFVASLFYLTCLFAEMLLERALS